MSLSVYADTQPIYIATLAINESGLRGQNKVLFAKGIVLGLVSGIQVQRDISFDEAWEFCLKAFAKHSLKIESGWIPEGWPTLEDYEKAAMERASQE